MTLPRTPARLAAVLAGGVHSLARAPVTCVGQRQASPDLQFATLSPVLGGELPAYRSVVMSEATFPQSAAGDW